MAFEQDVSRFTFETVRLLN